MSEEQTIESRIEALAESVKQTVSEEMQKLYNKMTPSEIHALDTNNPRFTKLLLCGLDMSKLIESQYASENMKSDLRKVRRIRKSNR
jgi:uncharacterized protein YdcH (DUF465 family)